MDLIAVLSSASDHRPQGTHARWWRWYVVVNLSMWKPDSSLIIILSQASACTEDLLPCSADNQLAFMLPTGAFLKGHNDSHHSMSWLVVQIHIHLSHTHTHTHRHAYRGIAQIHIAYPHAHEDKQMYTCKHVQAHKRSFSHTRVWWEWRSIGRVNRLQTVEVNGWLQSGREAVWTL